MTRSALKLKSVCFFVAFALFAAAPADTRSDEILGARSAQSRARWVNSANDFVLAMKQHREKVKLLALDIFNRHPTRFHPLSARDLASYIDQVHDVGKLEEPLASELFRYWGERIGSLPEPQKTEGLKVISKLNNEEAIRAQAFYQSNRWSPLVKEKAKILETLADSLERGLAPLSLEEFGGKMLLASEFNRGPWLDPYRDILLEYERNKGARYRHVTKGHHYEDVIRAGKLSADTAIPQTSRPVRRNASCVVEAVASAAISSARLTKSQAQMLYYLDDAQEAGRITLAEKGALERAVREGLITQDELRNRIFRNHASPRLQNNASGSSPASLEAASRMRRYETYVELPNGQRKLIQEVGSEDAWTVNGAAYLKSYPRGTKLIRRDRNSGAVTTLETRP